MVRKDHVILWCDIPVYHLTVGQCEPSFLQSGNQAWVKSISTVRAFHDTSLGVASGFMSQHFLFLVFLRTEEGFAI